jgi:small subunit ribosomal protein S6
MPFYESTFIVRPDASPQQVETLAEQVEGLIKEHGGSVPKTEIWGLRSLAYKIKKNRKGHYVFMNVEAEPATLAEMERSLRYNEDVLRYLSIRVEALESEASPMMRNKSHRDDRSIRREGDSESEGDNA